MTTSLDLLTRARVVSYKYGVTRMLVDWIQLRSKATHFGALVLSWFWVEYVTNEAFKNGFDLWVHGLPTYLRVLLGASISFYAWYRNPKRKEQSE
jgi:hypothetical protein